MYFCCLSEKKQEVQSSLLTLKKKIGEKGLAWCVLGRWGWSQKPASSHSSESAQLLSSALEAINHRT